MIYVFIIIKKRLLNLLKTDSEKNSVITFMQNSLLSLFLKTLLLFVAFMVVGSSFVYGQNESFQVSHIDTDTTKQIAVLFNNESGMETKLESESHIVLETIQEVAVSEKEVSKNHRVYPFALKTNLLYDLIGAPNLSLEVPVGEKFSIAAGMTYAYWRINNLYALQTYHGDIEGKYWFSSSNRLLTGWNVGVYASLGGRYDVQWKSGLQGDKFWTFGVVGGYSLPLSGAFNLDFSLAAGYIGTPEVRRYKRPQEGHLIWKETRYNTGLFSIAKACVSLVWLLETK